MREAEISRFGVVFPSELREYKICLTGYTGYVGSHLMASLSLLGVRPLLIPRPCTTRFEIKHADVAGSWKTSEELGAQLSQYKRLIVINLAGHFVKEHSGSDISNLVSGNIEFPLALFHALELAGNASLVNVGTSWEYSEFGEESPANLYAHLKLANAKYLSAVAPRIGCGAINLKLNDTYGGQDGRNKLMPLLHRALHSGEIAQLKSASQKINLLHIADVVEGLFEAAVAAAQVERGRVETAFLYADETVTIGRLTEIINALSDRKLRVSFEPADSNGERTREIWRDAPKLRHWKPRISLTDGLKSYLGM